MDRWIDGWNKYEYSDGVLYAAKLELALYIYIYMQMTQIDTGMFCYTGESFFSPCTLDNWFIIDSCACNHICVCSCCPHFHNFLNIAPYQNPLPFAASHDSRLAADDAWPVASVLIRWARG